MSHVARTVVSLAGAAAWIGMKTGDCTSIVGRTPWSARVPLDPLSPIESNSGAMPAGRRGRRPRTRGSAPPEVFSRVSAPRPLQIHAHHFLEDILRQLDPAHTKALQDAGGHAGGAEVALHFARVVHADAL